MINAENGNNSDNRDILMSFIWIHNQKEVDEYERNWKNIRRKKLKKKRKETKRKRGRRRKRKKE